MSVIFFSFYAFFLRHSSSLLPCICVPFLLLQTELYQHHFLLPSPPRSPSSPSYLLHVSDAIFGIISSRLLSSLLCQTSISSSPPSVVLLHGVAALCCCEPSLLISSTISFIFVQLVRSPSATSSHFPPLLQHRLTSISFLLYRHLLFG